MPQNPLTIFAANVAALAHEYRKHGYHFPRTVGLYYTLRAGLSPFELTDLAVHYVMRLNRLRNR